MANKIIAVKLREHAKKMHQQLLGVGLFLKRHWRLIGQITDEFKGQNLWRYMGCKDFDSWRRKVLLGRSTMYSNLRRWNGVKVGVTNKKITTAELDEIPGENVDHLIKLPEAQRFDKMWIKRAQTMDEEEFQSCVEKALPKDGKTHDVSVAEDRVDFKVRVTSSLKEMCEDIMSDVISSHSLKKDDKERALEIVFASYRSDDRETQMRVLTILGQCIIQQHETLGKINTVLKGDQPADKQLEEVEALNAEMATSIGGVMGKYQQQLLSGTWGVNEKAAKKSKSRTNGHAAAKGQKSKSAASPLQAIDGGKAAAKPTTVQ